MLAELILWAVLTGKDSWLVHRYSSDPNQRMQQLLDESENLRQIRDEVERFWMSDQPAHLTPDGLQNGVSSQLPTPPESTPAPSKAPKHKKFTIRFTFSISIDEQPSDPNQWMKELMYESEHSGPPQGEVDWFRMNDRPSHLTPDRVHGGVR
jgi:hypothetical protein